MQTAAAFLLLSGSASPQNVCLISRTQAARCQLPSGIASKQPAWHNARFGESIPSGRSAMKRFNLFLTAALGISLAAMAAPARAGDNDGQADLDKAMEKKLSATTTEDLGEVLTLSEGPSRKGSARRTSNSPTIWSTARCCNGAHFHPAAVRGEIAPRRADEDRDGLGRSGEARRPRSRRAPRF